MSTAHTIASIMRTARALARNRRDDERVARILADLECVNPCDIELAFDISDDDIEVYS